ncbi:MULTISPECIES: ion channel [Marinobacter]|uniref:ion channel n=1 Tax=Marinobacter TaxID=2742 RepID=UPI000DAEF5CC|nr:MULTISPECIES: ion channel [Marinobacter]
MLINLMVGMTVMLLCLLFQCALLIAALRFYIGHHAWLESPRIGARLLLLMAVMVLLVLGNLAQIGVWGWLFYDLGEFDDYATAFYHSGVNFATLGYGDMVMSERWRLLGPLESLNGIVMVGVSTSALLWTFQDTFKVMRSRRVGAP